MRPDMKKLLCERERHQFAFGKAHKGETKDRQKDEARDYEDWAPGGKIAMGKSHSGRSRRTKSLNENLTPIRNFLKKSVGRRWDEVFSEINEVCPNDSAVNAHVYQHLFHYVEVNPLIINGNAYRPWHEQKAWYSDVKGELHPLEGTQTYPSFYVGPEDGILYRAPDRKSRVREENKKKLKERERYEKWIDADHMAVKVNDIWWEATLSPIPMDILHSFYSPDGKTIIRRELRPAHVHDHYMYALADDKVPFVFRQKEQYRFNDADKHRALTTYYGKPVFCSKMRQLGSKEIRRMNLKNR